MDKKVAPSRKGQIHVTVLDLRIIIDKINELEGFTRFDHPIRDSGRKVWSIFEYMAVPCGKDMVRQAIELHKFRSSGNGKDHLMGVLNEILEREVIK